VNYAKIGSEFKTLKDPYESFQDLTPAEFKEK
jgi:hypothetical protein